MKKLEDARSKLISNIERLHAENSPMVKSITEGLIKKHGEGYDVQAELVKLKENYAIKLTETNENKDKLQAVLDKCQEYHNLIKVEKYFHEYFDRWRAADMEIGK